MMSRSLPAILASALPCLMLAFTASESRASVSTLKYFERVEASPVARVPHKAPASRAVKSAKKIVKKSAKPVARSKKNALRAGKNSAKIRKPRTESVRADKKLGREFVFDGSTVNGRYHSAGEAVAKVEQEKKLNNLVGLRRDFKDRLAAERDRLKQQTAE